MKVITSDPSNIYFSLLRSPMWSDVYLYRDPHAVNSFEGLFPTADKFKDFITPGVAPR